MTRLLVAAGLCLWAGCTLLLGGVRRLSRPSLAERLRPYHPGADGANVETTDARSFTAVLGAASRSWGGRLAALFGAGEDASLRLRRVHSTMSVTAFRTRQLGWSGGALAAAVTVAALVPLPLPLDGLLLAGGPVLAFLVAEQRLAAASESWQRSLLYELPVVAEQLAMLLAAGYSLGAAVNRLAQRGSGCCARDLAVVANRVRQGVPGEVALREWADIARVDAVDHLVSVLALNSEASDLGRLVGVEARQIRHEVHRRTLEVIERRSQQVWIPVTIATLVPGVILIAVPFLAALHTFSNA
ncbi:MAG TPA: type II secretion system F family protein [Acidimicrobiales bacterium]|nr:type II secretion system F family protein [Acidimicrobiales bacterium]